MRRGYTKTRVIFFNAPSAAHWGRPGPNKRLFHLTLIALCLLTTLAFVMAYYVFNYSHSMHGWTTGERLRLIAVQSGDGLKVTWYSELNTKAKLERALWTPNKAAVMLEADVSQHRYHDVENESFETIFMALTSTQDGDITLEQWLDTVIAARAGGIKLNFLSASSFERALQLLRDRSSDLLHVPVWLSINVANGPGGSGRIIDGQWAIHMVNSTYPRAQLVFGWSVDCCETDVGRFGRGTMETMLRICHKTPQPIIVSAPATQAAAQWRHFRWLLESSDRLGLLLWSPEDDKSWSNDTSYFELLTIRNDWSKRKIFYNMPEPRLAVFRQLAETAGSPLHYFDVRDRDATRVTWSHGANNEDALAQAGREGVLMVEGDVSLEGLGTSHQTSTAIMSHRGVHHNKNASISLQHWLDLVLSTNKAIKLDIKTSEAIVPALRVLQSKRSQLQRPVWVNGVILRGPNALHDPMNTTHFIRSINALFPELTVSLGWTSGWGEGQENEPYSWEMVEKMDKVARKFRQPVNFAVRAVLARQSWEKLDWLLHQSRRYTMTLWLSPSSSDRIAVSDLDYIRHQCEGSRVYFDVPPELVPPL